MQWFTIMEYRVLVEAGEAERYQHQRKKQQPTWKSAPNLMRKNIV